MHTIPAIPEKIETLYLDFETTSENPKLDSLNPWHNCDVLGVAVTWDDHARAYYLPVAHKYGENLDRTEVFTFVKNLVSRARVWCNQNVKYDAHVYSNCIGPLPPADQLRLRCTIVGAKLYNSDLQHHGGYNLTNLAGHFLKKDISHLENAFAPYLHKNKDYGAIPVDIMHAYSICDVFTARELDEFLRDNMPQSVQRVWDTEQRLTHVLFDVEQRGLQINLTEVRLEEFKKRLRSQRIEELLHAKIGKPINPNSSRDLFDTLCTHYGLPVLGWTNEDDAEKESNPSFDKHAMRRYLTHPDAQERNLLQVIEWIAEHRKISTTISHFLEPYQLLHVNEVLHSTYNQLVRTGRMSSREPNSQQLDTATKYLVHPRKGYCFVSCDLSQIEFRLIVHYIQNREAIKAYAENPDVDFHQLMADMCGVSRKAAKAINFAVGFGAGKAKTLLMIIAAGGNLKTAESAFDAYHERLPELRPMSRRAAAAVHARGYVFNLFGRRRHIPAEFAHIGFNSVIQSTAADILKDATVRLDDAIRASGLDISIVASVHDETLFELPIGYPLKRVVRALVRIIEATPPGISLSVPIRSSVGISSHSWGEASKASSTIKHGETDILENISAKLLTAA